MSRPPETPQPDLAAYHARTLLRVCGCDSGIDDRDAPPSAAIEWALSGSMAITGPAEGAPRFAAGALASAAEGAAMVLRALAPGTDLGCLDAPALLAERAAIADLERRGNRSAGDSARLLATRTDHIAVNLPRDEDWHLTPAWLSASESDFACARDWTTVERLVAERDGATLIERGRLMGLAVAPARKKVPAGRPLFRLQHPSERAATRRQRRIRLLDLSSLWAGPLATSLLAMAGFEVLKLESPERPDGARQGPEHFFRLMNANKQGCALDLHRERDREAFERLLENADIVFESARPRALAQLGYDAASWVTASPGRIWASITGHGRAHEWIAFGDDAAVAAGLAWSPALDDITPTFCGDAIADPLAGLHGAALVLAHWRSGRGGLLDLSLSDIAAHAATLRSDGLTLPVEARPEGWVVLEGDRSVGIAEPRARAVERTAPALSAPSETLLAEWSSAC